MAQGHIFDYRITWWTTGELATALGVQLTRLTPWLLGGVLPAHTRAESSNAPRQLTFADCLALGTFDALLRMGVNRLSAMVAVRSAVLKGEFGRMADQLAQGGDALLAKGGPIDTEQPCFFAVLRHTEYGAEQEATGLGEIATAASLHRFIAPGGALASSGGAVVPLAPLLRRLRAGLPLKITL